MLFTQRDYYKVVIFIVESNGLLTVNVIYREKDYYKVVIFIVESNCLLTVNDIHRETIMKL